MRTDQKALQHIYNSKHLDDISDEISDIVVLTYRYNFSVEYVAGKDNELADYLSRNPRWGKESETHGPWITDDFGKEITIEAHVCAAKVIKRYHDSIKSDPLLQEMRDCRAVDEQYTAVIKAIREKRSKSWVQNSSNNPCRDYISVWDRLGTADDNDSTLLTLDIKRLVVPLQAQKNILKILHYSHQGISKTYAAARTRYYWPSMKEDIQQLTQSCTVCKELNQKARTNPNIDPEQPKTDLGPF